jgi:hypothetical protein
MSWSDGAPRSPEDVRRLASREPSPWEWLLLALVFAAAALVAFVTEPAASAPASAVESSAER